MTTRTLPTSASDWQLYSRKGSANAARALTAALKRAEKKARKALDRTHGDKNAANVMSKIFNEVMYPVMDKHASVGASDTEPRVTAKLYLDSVVEEFDFYCLNW